MPNVSFKRNELTKVLPEYILIRDCLDGENAVKRKRTLYLFQPNKEDVSNENLERYNAYLQRAVFYNVAYRTLNGLVGQVFLKDPVVKVPESLTAVIEDANGSGIDIFQSSKKATNFVLSYGRSGIFVDYPRTDGAVTIEQLQTGNLRPTINNYEPWRIINWRMKERGAKQVLSLIVLEETYLSYDDGFEIKTETSYRVLRLGLSKENKTEGLLNDENVYTVEIWQGKNSNFGISESYQPKGADGEFLTEIPFVFVGSENNDAEVDRAPLYDLCALNIAHYRNSADYEESSFITGQPTPVFTGLTEEWVKNVLNERIALGARGSVSLPVGGAASLLQATSNTMPFEAMEHKEKQMVALGAKLVEQQSVQRTATEAGLDAASQASVLLSVSKNVSTAFEEALKWCLVFVGNPESEVSFKLNNDFQISTVSPEERARIIAEWQGGALTFGEMRNILRKAGAATEDDSQAKSLIAQETAQAMAIEQPTNLPNK